MEYDVERPILKQQVGTKSTGEDDDESYTTTDIWDISASSSNTFDDDGYDENDEDFDIKDFLGLYGTLYSRKTRKMNFTSSPTSQTTATTTEMQYQ